MEIVLGRIKNLNLVKTRGEGVLVSCSVVYEYSNTLSALMNLGLFVLNKY